MATNSAKVPANSSRLGRFINAPSAQRSLFIVSATVLVAGLVTFLSLRVFHHAAAAPSKPTLPASGAKPVIHVKPSGDAYKVAREFLETAVLGKNLHEAYPLVGAPLKAGISRKEWESGTNQIIYYPAANAKTVKFVPISSTKRKLYMRMDLVPTKGSGQQPLTWYMALVNKNGNWLVVYWLPENPIGVPDTSSG